MHVLVMHVAWTLWNERNQRVFQRRRPAGSQAGLWCGTPRHFRRGFLDGSRLQPTVRCRFACCGLNTDPYCRKLDFCKGTKTPVSAC
jgi:hypothetical protein